jgi:ABC-type branched-subunit amino acid transport system substrate-binding protein
MQAADDCHQSSSDNNNAETIPYDRHSNSMLRLILLFSTPCVISVRAWAQQTTQHIQLRIGLITAGEPPVSEGASVARGVRLGAAEARQTAQLFGDDVQLFEAAGAGRGAVSVANRLSSASRIQLLIATSGADAEALSRFAEAHHLIFFNASSRSQGLRNACDRYTFHIEASDAMYANAGRMAADDGSTSIETGRRSLRATTDSIVLWSPMLERFGASQINDRYRDKYMTGMDGGGWAGWAAVKLGAEAALRAHSASPARLLEYLESSSTQFDGHKGWPLTFRRSDHQLRQPLYVVFSPPTGTVKRSVRDIPDLRSHQIPNATGRASDRVLDSLIGSDARVCPWSARP